MSGSPVVLRVVFSRTANRELRLADSSFSIVDNKLMRCSSFMQCSFLCRSLCGRRCFAAPAHALQRRVRSQIILWRGSHCASIEAPLLVTESGSKSRRPKTGTYSRFPNFVYSFWYHFWYPQVGPRKHNAFYHLEGPTFAAGGLFFLSLPHNASQPEFINALDSNRPRTRSQICYWSNVEHK